MGSGKELKSGEGECARCGRRLKNPVSAARGIGPKCWRLSGGGTFDKDLDVDKLEWTRREKLLKSGEEISLGTYNLHDNLTMQVCIRYRERFYEAYGRLSDGRERIFGMGTDLKIVYAYAIAAGPTAVAETYRMRKRKVV